MEQSHASVPMPTSPPLDEPQAADDEVPTYAETRWGGLTHYVCLLDGYECWHLDVFAEHVARLHDGRMIRGPAGPEPAASTPPPLEAPYARAGYEAEALEADPDVPPEAPAADEEA